jgi:hypothetical protein
MFGRLKFRSEPQAVPARVARERQRIARRYQPSARELFPVLRDRLLASRPVIGTRATFPKGSPSRRSLVAETEPIYGKPTFRNRIDENGAHV